MAAPILVGPGAAIAPGLDLAVRTLHIPTYTHVAASHAGGAHTAYTIQLTSLIAQWRVARRYQEFVALDRALTQHASQARAALDPTSRPAGRPSDPRPPARLPPSHWRLGRVPGQRLTPAQLEDRRAQLEAYLQAILHADDPVWRSAPPWDAFLKTPALPPALAAADASLQRGARDAKHPEGAFAAAEHAPESVYPVVLSAPVWQHLYACSLDLVRDIKATAQPSAAAAAGGTASMDRHRVALKTRRHLALLEQRIVLLQAALDWDGASTTPSAPAGAARPPSKAHGTRHDASSPQPLPGAAYTGLTAGERTRRGDMVANLRVEHDRLAQHVGLHGGGPAVTPAGASGAGRSAWPSSPAAAAAAADAAWPRRHAAGGAAGGTAQHRQQHAQLLSGPPASGARSGRVFGRTGAITDVHAETDETRAAATPDALLQLQRDKFAEQDQGLDLLAATVRRQLHLGRAIGEEIEKQDRIIDQLDAGVTQGQSGVKTVQTKANTFLKG
ncbi:hypothetical protein CXG81DRAFT_25079 [Caulochytrium protostelioides]|uniref:Phox-like protein n=1 Tax=Caulochytrium protostelioides TaxID=1555241 RepID=A0A4V1IUZ7_9FUNG|nr:hypothetical protein CXG81DRAFT_25079 [Caulochytrium protostelioides]|eukprot:RKP02299.1 hypothetical protein CXG81DRAFT_25079 [Caulochytrium protostelioides]